ncbi:MAG: hypothetical protein ACTSRR_09770 [Candidatus Heimdallarchaeaceae archaeon]
MYKEEKYKIGECPPHTPPIYMEDSLPYIYYGQKVVQRGGKWRGSYERECVSLTLSVLNEIYEQFEFCYEQEFIDIMKERISQRYYRIGREIEEAKSITEIKQLVLAQYKESMLMVKIFKSLYDDVLDAIKFSRAFTIRSLCEEIEKPETNGISERTRKRVMRTIRVLQRINVLNSYVLTKPYIKNIRKTAVFFLCNATEDDLANVIAQQINVDRGFGYPLSGADKVKEHNQKVSKDAEELRKKKNEKLTEKMEDIWKKQKEAAEKIKEEKEKDEKKQLPTITFRCLECDKKFKILKVIDERKSKPYCRFCGSKKVARIDVGEEDFA